MRIALYGGAFNPIARHHILIAEKILEHVDSVCFIPAYKSASGKTLVEGNHRIAMCELVCSTNKRFTVSDFEIKNRLTGSPFDIITKFLHVNDKNKNKYYFAMGLDNALNTNQWVDSEKSLKLLPYIVVARSNYFVPQDAWFTKYPHIFIDNINLLGSSTKAKSEYIEHNTTNLLDYAVLNYIKKHELYK